MDEDEQFMRKHFPGYRTDFEMLMDLLNFPERFQDMATLTEADIRWLISQNIEWSPRRER
jgi:hypothetical protein